MSKQKIKVPPIENMMLAGASCMYNMGSIRGNPIWVDLSNFNMHDRPQEFLLVTNMLKELFGQPPVKSSDNNKIEGGI